MTPGKYKLKKSMFGLKPDLIFNVREIYTETAYCPDTPHFFITPRGEVVPLDGNHSFYLNETDVEPYYEYLSFFEAL